MKKILIVLTAIIMLSYLPCSAAENPVSSFFARLWKVNNDIDAKIDAQQKKMDEQQRKYEEKLRARDEKILKQQQERQEIYEAHQKRLEEKRELLRQLLEE